MAAGLRGGGGTAGVMRRDNPEPESTASKTEDHRRIVEALHPEPQARAGRGNQCRGAADPAHQAWACGVDPRPSPRQGRLRLAGRCPNCGSRLPASCRSRVIEVE